MAQKKNTKNVNKSFSTWFCNGFWINRIFWDFRALLDCWAPGAWKCRLALSILYKNRDSWGRARGIGPGTLSKPWNCRSNTTNCNCQPGFEFSNPSMTDENAVISLKIYHSIFPIVYRHRWNVSHSAWVRSLPHPPGVGFYAPQGRATPSSHHHGGKACSFRSALCQTKTKQPNNVQILNMTQLLREAKPGAFQTRVFPTFFGKGPDCVADPFGTVPRRCW